MKAINKLFIGFIIFGTFNYINFNFFRYCIWRYKIYEFGKKVYFDNIIDTKNLEFKYLIREEK